MPLKYIIDDKGTIAVVVDGTTKTIASDHPSYAMAYAAVTADDEDGLRVAIGHNAEKVIHQYTAGRILLDGDAVFINKAPAGAPPRYRQVDHGVATRAVELVRNGLPVEPLLRFIDRLFANPRQKAVQELYPWLAFQAIPITDDGCFLGYKRVDDQGYSFYTGKNETTVTHADGRIEVIPPQQKVPYPVGGVVAMDRNEVDDNGGNTCSQGLHVGNVDYVGGFNSHTGKILIVKVDPTDVVSVPPTETNKLRTCRLQVVAELAGLKMESPLYTADAQPYEIKEITPPHLKPADDGRSIFDVDDDEVDEPAEHEYRITVAACPRCTAPLTLAHSLLLTIEVDDEEEDEVDPADEAEDYFDEGDEDEIAAEDASETVIAPPAPRLVRMLGHVEDGRIVALDGDENDVAGRSRIVSVRCAACGTPLSPLVIHYHNGERVGPLETADELPAHDGDGNGNGEGGWLASLFRRFRGR